MQWSHLSGALQCQSVVETVTIFYLHACNSSHKCVQTMLPIDTTDELAPIAYDFKKKMHCAI